MEEAFKCNLCSEEFNSIDKLNVHIERQHEEIRDRKNRNFKCNICGQEYRTGQHLVNHTRTHTGERPFKCEVSGCGLSFKQIAHLNDHINYKHNHQERRFNCDIAGCLRTARTSTKIIQHKKMHTAERPLACPNGGRGFRAKSKSHTAHNAPAAYSEAKTFACSKCDHKTAFKGNLKVHMRRRHSSRRDFKCNHQLCEKSFKSLHGLKSHVSNRHGVRNFQCDYPDCGQRFANARNCSNHKLNVHGTKIHVCPNQKCTYSTNFPRDLALHMSTHEGTNEKIPCSIEGCEYKGKNSRALEVHLRRHKTRLRCPVSSCARYATTKEVLENHVKLHNDLGRPFQCPLCCKHYQTMQHLQYHCVVHINEKPFQCGHCELTAARQSIVKAHISSVHPAVEFPFIVHLLDDRECLRCKLIMPSAEFLAHCKSHVSRDVNI